MTVYLPPNLVGRKRSLLTVVAIAKARFSTRSANLLRAVGTDSCWPLKGRIFVQIGRPAGQTEKAVSANSWLVEYLRSYAGSSWTLSGEHGCDGSTVRIDRREGSVVLSDEAKQQIEAQTAKTKLSVGSAAALSSPADL